MIYSYAVINKNEKERMQSASGGIMSLLAKEVINAGGIVYGVENRIYDMRFVEINEARDIFRIRGSKYVRASNFSETIRTIKNNIDAGDFFMFVGTPCQTKAIRNIIDMKKYHNCLLVDLICHGVIDKDIYNKYIKWIEDKYGENIENISFRDKEKGWKNQRWKMTLNSGLCVGDEDVEILKKIYNAHYAHEEGCLNCNFTNLERPGDLTIGDLWGVEKDKSIIDDDKGINLVIINNDVGLRYFNLIQKDAWVKEVNIDDYMQPQLKEKIKTNIKERNLFFKEINKFDKIIKIMFSRSLYYRVLRNIKIKISK